MTKILPNVWATALIVPPAAALCLYLTKAFGPLTLAERQWAQNTRLSATASHRPIGDFAEEQYFAGAIQWHFAVGLITLLATIYIVAPYGGRLTSSKKDIPLLERLCSYSVATSPAWLLQECPTLIAVCLALIPAFLSWYAVPREMIKGAAAPFYGYFEPLAKMTTLAPLTIFQQYAGVTFYPTILLFLIHYIHRTLIFPLFFEDSRGHFTKWSRTQEAPVIKNTLNSDGVGGVVLENKQKLIRSNPLLTVVLAGVYCCFNGCLQVSANIASTTSQLLSPVYVSDLSGSAEPISTTGWRLFNWPMRALIRSVGGKNAVDALKVTGAPLKSSTTPLEFIFGEFFGFNHIEAPNWFIAGSLLFFIGMWINVCFDYYMFGVARQRRNAELLRRDAPAVGTAIPVAKNADQYIIPKFPLFDVVSAPNYLGEIIEWTGYALALWGASGSDLSFIAALSFVFYTLCNLAPRALASHSWYRSRFGPKFTTQWALVPYVM